MGKSPGKWIKTLILGKKSSKSNIPKGREKTKNKGEILVSSNLPVSNLTVDTPLASPPLVATDVNDKVGSENIVAGNLPNDGIVLSAAKDDGPTQAIKTASSEDPEKFRLEEAVITLQAAFRGYAAHREFQTIKCIIRLQSIVRGNLVRRQAVSTLSCVQGIVKFQALVRGHKGVKFSTQVEMQSKNAFVQKLLASLPSTIHLRLQYGSEDPNSASQWLERWTLSRLWKPPSQHEGNLDTKSCGKHGTFHKVETDQGKSKRRVQRLSGANGEYGSAGSLVSSEKRKGNLRKPSSLPEVSAREHQQNDVKVKSNLRKASSACAKEVPALSENENGKPKDRKTSRSATTDVMEQVTSGVSKKPKDKTLALLKKSDQKGMGIPSEDQVENLSTKPIIGTHPLESDVTNEDAERMNPELNLRDDCITNGENQQASQRRASLPAKLNYQENAVHNTHNLPSYMAPTESVKARLRGQGSPRFAKEVVEKNGLARRYSLSSSTNSLLSSLSPRAHRLVRTTGKGMIKSDISLTSTRDGGVTMVLSLPNDFYPVWLANLDLDTLQYLMRQHNHQVMRPLASGLQK